MFPAPGSRRRVPFRGRVPPILPAVVKSELKDLLAFSPVLLSDFEKAFVRRFGRTFQYMQYGFLSMFEVLDAASDVIAVEQTRMGSLLTLRKNLLEEKQRRWSPGEWAGSAGVPRALGCRGRRGGVPAWLAPSVSWSRKLDLPAERLRPVPSVWLP